MRRRKPVFLKSPVDDQDELQPLPAPRRSWPFRLDISEVTGPAEGVDSMEFHMVGDTGSLRRPEFQRHVAKAMASQIRPGTGDRKGPHFLLHLGDIVYDHGEASEYAAQFFGPYEVYPAPVFALAGNHDGGINPLNPVPYNSLDAYMAAFCAPHAREVSFSGGSRRRSMTQPNVYWSMRTPLANFICLYGNTTKFGHIDGCQFDWLLHELSAFGWEKGDKALFLCLHHAPYSADTNHGSSPNMIHLLERAFAITGVVPDVVCSGHVHNYQRFSRHCRNGEVIRYLVSGAGGYADLHKIAAAADERVCEDERLCENVQLESYCDDRHGFLKMRIERTPKELLLSGGYYIVDARPGKEDPQPQLFERFLFPLHSTREAILVP